VNTIGTHLLCEFSGCPAETLNDVDALTAAMHAAAAAAEATVLNGYFQRYGAVGVSGVLCLAESHLSVHTWPESGYAAVDIFTCGDRALPRKAIAHLFAALGAAHRHVIEVRRGLTGAGGAFTSFAGPQAPEKPAAATPVSMPTPTSTRKRYKPAPIDLV
jgi:S-adenosylmethionine decarboxylase